MKISVMVTLTLGGEVDAGGKASIRKYIKNAIMKSKGAHGLNEVKGCEAINSISGVMVSNVSVVMTRHEARAAAGKARAAALSAKRRKEIAQQAAEARWANRRKSEG